jgi:hypothetical protein
MNVIDRNINFNNKQIQNISNNISNILSLPNKDPKQVKTIPALPSNRVISYKKNVPYSLEYATKNNIPERSSYYNDLIDRLNVNDKSKNDIHNVLTHNYDTTKFAKDSKIIIEKVKPKNQVSGITDKNLMSHIIPPTSLTSNVVPKNNINSMNTYRRAESTNMPPIIAPVTTIKEKIIVKK